MVDNNISAHEVLECGLLSGSQRGKIASCVQAYMPELLAGRSGDELDIGLQALQDEYGLSGMCHMVWLACVRFGGVII